MLSKLNLSNVRYNIWDNLHTYFYMYNVFNLADSVGDLCIYVDFILFIYLRNMFLNNNYSNILLEVI